MSAFNDYLDMETLRELRPGAGQETEFAAAESWLNAEDPWESAPETTYHRAWAKCVISQACTLLKEEVAADSGSAAAELIAAEVSPSGRRAFNPDLAAKLGVSPPEALERVRSARRRLRELILETIRETVSAQSDVEVEFWDLFKTA